MDSSRVYFLSVTEFEGRDLDDGSSDAATVAAAPDAAAPVHPRGELTGDGAPSTWTIPIEMDSANVYFLAIEELKPEPMTAHLAARMRNTARLKPLV